MISSLRNAPFQVPYQQTINHQTSALLQDKDSNGSGSLSKDELDVDSAVFDQIDLNQDGEADRTELNMARIEADLDQITQQIQNVDKMTCKLIQSEDADGDGALNAKELGVSEDLFNHIDQNQDGKADQHELNMTRIEMDIYHREQQLQIIDSMTRDLIQEKDIDGNGTLTAEELGADEDVFNHIDQNQDGEADQNELNGVRMEIDEHQGALKSHPHKGIDVNA